MEMYSHFRICDFIIFCGNKGCVIKEYFANYILHSFDVTFDIGNNSIHVHQKRDEPWTVTLVDTSKKTMIRVRLNRIAKFIQSDKLFCLTYGDGVSDLNLSDLVAFHRQHGKLALLTATPPRTLWSARNT